MTERLLNDFSTRFADVEENLKRIREAIAEAARKSGRRPEDLSLIHIFLS